MGQFTNVIIVGQHFATLTKSGTFSKDNHQQFRKRKRKKNQEALCHLDANKIIFQHTVTLRENSTSGNLSAHAFHDCITECPENSFTSSKFRKSRQKTQHPYVTETALTASTVSSKLEFPVRRSRSSCNNASSPWL